MHTDAVLLRQFCVSVTLSVSRMFLIAPLQHLKEPSGTISKVGVQTFELAIAGAAAPTAMTGTAQAAPLAMVRRLGRRTSIPCDFGHGTTYLLNAGLPC